MWHRNTADYLKVNHSFLEQLAYIAVKLDAIQDGERKALDNSILVLCSSMLHSGHDATKLAVVLLGAKADGQVLDYLDKPNRKMCSLYLSLLNKYRIPTRQIWPLE